MARPVTYYLLGLLGNISPLGDDAVRISGIPEEDFDAVYQELRTYGLCCVRVILEANAGISDRAIILGETWNAIRESVTTAEAVLKQPKYASMHITVLDPIGDD